MRQIGCGLQTYAALSPQPVALLPAYGVALFGYVTQDNSFAPLVLFFRALQTWDYSRDLCCGRYLFRSGLARLQRPDLN